MDHDLRDNDLAEFFSHFGEWWSQYGNTVLAVVLAGAIVFLGYKFWTIRSYQATESAWSELANTTSPQNYLSVAADHSDPAVQALAYLRAGDLFAQAARAAHAPAAASQPAQHLSPEQALSQAQDAYQHVLAVAKHPVYRINATLGLARVAESRRDWSAAQKQYQQALDAAQTASLPSLALQAQHGLDMLPQLQEPVVFPATQPATQPAATQPATTQPAK